MKDIEKLREKIEEKPRNIILFVIGVFLVLVGLEWSIEMIMGIFIPGFDMPGPMDVVNAIKEIIQSFG